MKLQSKNLIDVDGVSVKMLKYCIDNKLTQVLTNKVMHHSMALSSQMGPN